MLDRTVVVLGSYFFDSWDLHPDGDRFVVAQDVGAEVAPNGGTEVERGRVIVVTNWFDEMRARLAEGGG